MASGHDRISQGATRLRTVSDGRKLEPTYLDSAFCQRIRLHVAKVVQHQRKCCKAMQDQRNCVQLFVTFFGSEATFFRNRAFK